MSDLPEMYAQSLRAQPEDCGHTFQANHECPCHGYYVTHLWLIALIPIRVCPLGSLYMHALKVRLCKYCCSYDCYSKRTSDTDIPESLVGRKYIILHCLKTNHSVY